MIWCKSRSLGPKLTISFFWVFFFWGDWCSLHGFGKL
jgi:hypothetical protein